MTDPGRSTRRPIDDAALDHIGRRLRRAAAAPWLHGEVARRMGERLGIVKLQPARVLDWHAQVGGGSAELRRAYPRAQLVAVEAGVADAAAEPAAPWWSPRHWRSAAPAALAETAVAPGQAQLVWSNMALHFVADPQALMAQWQQALAVDGFLMFSTLGPGSLERLRLLYREHGWAAPFAPFVDMHDLGDMLVQAGFADPVMDQETLTLTWADPAALLAELRALGGNADPARHGGLRTPRWRTRLAAALRGTAGADGRPALQFEVVYGHAFKPLPRVRMSPSAEVPVEDLRTMARAARRRA